MRVAGPRIDNAPGTTPSGPKVSLLVMNRDGVVVIPLPAQGEITIGRAVECDVCIADVKASRVHAALRLAKETTIVDRGSRNGTLLDDRRLEPNQPTKLAL